MSVFQMLRNNEYEMLIIAKRRQYLSQTTNKQHYIKLR
jgi:hypothetical protein